MKTPSKDDPNSWVKVWVTGYVGTAPSFATKAVQPHPMTADEIAAAADQAREDAGPGFDD